MVVATDLPKVYQSACALLGSLDGLATDGGQDFDLAVDQVSQGAKALAQFALRVAEQQRAATDRATDLVDLTSLVVDDLANTGKLASQIRILALNASVTATREGQAGRGFAVLTEELVRMAETTVTSARSAQEVSNAIESKLRAARREMEEARLRREQVHRSAREEVEAANLRVRDMVSELLGVIRGSATAVQPLLDPIADVMTAIQRQDALSQGLEHVLLALAEIGEQNHTGEIEQRGKMLAFGSRASRLSDQLVADVHGEMQTLLQDVMGKLAEMHGSTGGLSDLSATSDALVQNAQGAAAPLLAALESVGAEAGSFASMGELARLLEQLPLCLADLEEIVTLFDNLAVLIRIQLCDCGGDERHGAFSTQIGDIRASFREFVVRMERTSRRLLKRVTRLTDDRAPLLLAEYRGVEEEIGRAGTALERAAARMLEQVAGLHALERRTRAAIEESLGALREVADRSERWDSLRRSCKDLSERYDAALADLSRKHGLVDEPEADKELAALIGRFTLLSHQRLAATTAAIHVADGDDLGVLTLF